MSAAPMSNVFLVEGQAKRPRTRNPLQRNLMHLQLDQRYVDSIEDAEVVASLQSIDLRCQQISFTCTPKDLSEIGIQIADLLLKLDTYVRGDSLFNESATIPLVAEYTNALIIKNAAGVKSKKGIAPRWLDDLPHQICNTLGNACTFEYRVCNIETTMDPEIALSDDKETLCICFVGSHAVCQMAGVLMRETMRITQLVYDQIRVYRKSLDEDGFEPQPLLIAEKGIANSLLAYIHSKCKERLISRLGSQTVQQINSTAGVTLMRLAMSKFRGKLIPSQSSFVPHKWTSHYQYATDYVAEIVLKIDAEVLAEMRAQSFKTEVDCQYQLGDYENLILRSQQKGATGDNEIDPETTTEVAQPITNRKRGRPPGRGRSAATNARKKNRRNRQSIQSIKIVIPKPNKEEEAEEDEEAEEEPEAAEMEDEEEPEATEEPEAAEATEIEDEEAEEKEKSSSTQVGDEKEDHKAAEEEQDEDETIAHTQTITASAKEKSVAPTSKVDDVDDDEVNYEEEEEEEEKEGEGDKKATTSTNRDEEEKEQGEITEKVRSHLFESVLLSQHCSLVIRCVRWQRGIIL